MAIGEQLIEGDSLPIPSKTYKDLPDRLSRLRGSSQVDHDPVHLTLTHVVPTNRATFCIRPYLNNSKMFFVQCLAPEQSKQRLHDGQTRWLPLLYRYHNYSSPVFRLPLKRAQTVLSQGITKLSEKFF